MVYLSKSRDASKSIKKIESSSSCKSDDQMNDDDDEEQYSDHASTQGRALQSRQNSLGKKKPVQKHDAAAKRFNVKKKISSRMKGKSNQHIDVDKVSAKNEATGNSSISPTTINKKELQALKGGKRKNNQMLYLINEQTRNNQVEVGVPSHGQHQFAHRNGSHGEKMTLLQRVASPIDKIIIKQSTNPKEDENNNLSFQASHSHNISRQSESKHKGSRSHTIRFANTMENTNMTYHKDTANVTPTRDSPANAKTPRIRAEHKSPAQALIE